MNLMKFFPVLSSLVLSCTSSNDDNSVVAGNSISVGTPRNFSEILQQSYELTPVAKTAVSDRDRLLIKVHSTNYVGIDSNQGVEFDSALALNSDLFAKLFYIVKQADADCYRIDSAFHGLFSFDYSSTDQEIQLNNSWGYGRGQQDGYLCFSIDIGNGTIQATKYYTFDSASSSFTEDSSFTAQYVNYDSTNSRLVLSGTPSTFSFWSSGIDFAIPNDFNPESTAIADNHRVDWESLNLKSYTENPLSGDKTYKDTSSTYQSQVLTAGDDASTATAAESMLSTIESTLTASGARMRYDSAVYLTFREALLARTLVGDSIVNGQLAQNNTPYVYFTNEVDEEGVPHPFMVIATYSITDTPIQLLDVPTPPGASDEGGYDSQDVTRDATLQTYSLKIPLKDYGEVSSISENVMDRTLADDVNETTYTVYNYASTSYMGVAVDGVVIYPILNNTLTSAQKRAEITNSGIHVGRGMGLHWHADGHGGNGNGFNLYNLADYDTLSHPPLIGFAMDGIALFGKYEEEFATMDGYDEELDGFGVHSHGAYGVHYHAHEAPSSDVGESGDYSLHVLMKGAWKGIINDIPEFFSTATQKNRYVGSAESISLIKEK